MKQTKHNKALIHSCIKGDSKAQFSLYEQYKIYLFGVCMRYSKSRAEAEDILQEGFYLIFRDLNKFKFNSSLKSWMHRVMVNTALMHIRKHHKINFANLEVENALQIPSANYHPQEGEMAQVVMKMLQYLPLTYQTVFNLRAIEGYSFKEIGEKLEVNEATLRSHYLRARTQLQKLLKKEFEDEQRGK